MDVWVLTTEYAAGEEQDMLPAGGLSFLRLYADRDDAIAAAKVEVADKSNAGEDDEAEVEYKEQNQTLPNGGSLMLNEWTITSFYEITTVAVRNERVR